MKSLRNGRIIRLLTVFFLILAHSSAAAGSFSLRSLTTGMFDFPVAVRIHSPAYVKLARFGEERITQLNRLMKHFSVETRTDGGVSFSSVMIDGREVYNVSEISDERETRRIYSVNPETVYVSASGEPEGESSAVELFQNENFYPVNQLMEDARGILEEACRRYAELGKTEKVNISYRGYGRGVKRITLRFTKEYVAEHFPAALSSCAETPESAQFLGSLAFDGVQRFILVFDEDDHLIRAGYDGIAGPDRDNLRKVSLAWKCLREEDRVLDELTMKTPAVKGYDRYNMTYTRDLDMTEPDNHHLKWNMELDLRAGDVRKRISYKAEIGRENDAVTGQIIYNEKRDGRETKTVIAPSLMYKNDGEYSGTLEITEYSGKIVTGDITAGIDVIRVEPMQMREPGELKMINTAGTEGKQALTALEQALAVQLIRGMMVLPEEDTEFLSEDIPDDVWNTLTQSLF